MEVPGQGGEEEEAHEGCSRNSARLVSSVDWDAMSNTTGLPSTFKE